MTDGRLIHNDRYILFLECESINFVCGISMECFSIRRLFRQRTRCLSGKTLVVYNNCFANRSSKFQKQFWQIKSLWYKPIVSTLHYWEGISYLFRAVVILKTEYCAVGKFVSSSTDALSWNKHILSSQFFTAKSQINVFKLRALNLI